MHMRTIPWILVICLYSSLLNSNPNIGSNCLKINPYTDYEIADFKYDPKKSQFEFCYKEQGDEQNHTLQCFLVSDFVDAQKAKAKPISSDGFSGKSAQIIFSAFGSSHTKTHQAELQILSANKIQLCTPVYTQNQKCYKIKMTKDLIQRLHPKDRVTTNHDDKNKFQSFYTDQLAGFILHTNTSDKLGQNIRKLIIAQKKGDNYEYLYSAILPGTGLEYNAGFIRDKRVFIEDCAAGPSCVLLQQGAHRNHFKEFTLNSYGLQEIVLQNDLVLLMRSDANQLALYDDKKQKIIKQRSFNEALDASDSATLIRLENQFLIFYTGTRAGQIDEVDPLTLRKSEILSIKKCE